MQLVQLHQFSLPPLHSSLLQLEEVSNFYRFREVDYASRKLSETSSSGQVWIGIGLSELLLFFTLVLLASSRRPITGFKVYHLYITYILPSSCGTGCAPESAGISRVSLHFLDTHSCAAWNIFFLLFVLSFWLGIHVDHMFQILYLLYINKIDCLEWEKMF